VNPGLRPGLRVSARRFPGCNGVDPDVLGQGEGCLFRLSADLRDLRPLLALLQGGDRDGGSVNVKSELDRRLI
jgi:hypothetical protein